MSTLQPIIFILGNSDVLFFLSMALQPPTTLNCDSHVLNVTVAIKMYFIKFVPFGYSCIIVSVQETHTLMF